jgi:uncharacterized membrane protein
MKDSTVLALAASMGALAGLRSIVPPAILTHAASRNLINLRGTPLSRLRGSKAVKIATALAVGEMVADKLPFAPSRLKPGPLAARAISGALCGAAIAASERGPIVAAAAIGAGAAIGGSFAGYHLRQLLNRKLPDTVSALIGDAVTVASGAAIIDRLAA